MAASFEEIALHAPRVTLRWISEADAPALFALFGDREVMRYWSRPPLTSIAEAVALVRDVCAGYRTGESLQLAIERNDDRRFVGTCTLFHFHRGNRRAEIGYALAPAAWGRGLMHESLCALLAHAFGPLALHRLEADIDPRNTASARSLERLGFRKEGHLRERWIVGGEVSDSALYGLLRQDWRANPPAAGRPAAAGASP